MNDSKIRLECFFIKGRFVDRRNGVGHFMIREEEHWRSWGGWCAKALTTNARTRNSVSLVSPGDVLHLEELQRSFSGRLDRRRSRVIFA